MWPLLHLPACLPATHPALHFPALCCIACLQELQDLAGISSAESPAASRTATALRQRRVAIRLCQASYDLLTQALQVGATPQQPRTSPCGPIGMAGCCWLAYPEFAPLCYSQKTSTACLPHCCLSRRCSAVPLPCPCPGPERLPALPVACLPCLCPQGPKQLAMLGIINEHIKFEVGWPAGLSAGMVLAWQAARAAGIEGWWCQRADENDAGVCCIGCFRGACRAREVHWGLREQRGACLNTPIAGV